jgi:hypothetical protein
MPGLPARSPSASSTDGVVRRSPPGADPARTTSPVPREPAERTRTEDGLEPQWVSAIDAATD